MDLDTYIPDDHKSLSDVIRRSFRILLLNFSDANFISPKECGEFS